jgi:hypothetical protein
MTYIPNLIKIQQAAFELKHADGDGGEDRQYQSHKINFILVMQSTHKNVITFVLDTVSVLSDIHYEPRTTNNKFCLNATR